MSKIAPLVLTLVFMIGGMVMAGKFISQKGPSCKGQIIKQYSAAMAKQDDAIREIMGQKGPAPRVLGAPRAPGMNASASALNVESLLAGGTPVSSENAQPEKPAAPAGPMTAICNVGEKKNQPKSADTQVKMLPPGAQATFVDGRLQIFYPHGKPKSHPGN